MVHTLVQASLTCFWSITPRPSYYLQRFTCMNLKFMASNWLARGDPNISNLLRAQSSMLRIHLLALTKKNYAKRLSKLTKRIKVNLTQLPQHQAIKTVAKKLLKFNNNSRTWIWIQVHSHNNKKSIVHKENNRKMKNPLWFKREVDKVVRRKIRIRTRTSNECHYEKELYQLCKLSKHI